MSNLTVFRVFVVPQGSGLDTQALVSKLPKKNIHRLFFFLLIIIIVLLYVSSQFNFDKTGRINYDQSRSNL